VNPTGPFFWPKLTDLNAAILSDITPNAQGVMARHKNGINVLYANGSGSWVPLRAFENDIVGNTGQPSTSMNDPNTAFSNAYDKFMLDETTNPPTGLWADLDRYTK
jgi:hypothetical protein